MPASGEPRGAGRTDEIDAMEQVEGLGVAAGIAIGRAVCISMRVPDLFQIPVAPERVDDEIARFHRAVTQAQEEINLLRAKVGQELGEELAGIFDAQGLFLRDPTFLEGVEAHIRNEAINAEWAVYETSVDIQQRFEAIDAEYLRARAEDLRDVGRYVLRALQGVQHHQLSDIEDGVVIVADDLTPSDAVRLGRKNVVGFAIEHGSRTSHTTIIARSLGIPAVAGVSGLRQRLSDQPEVPVILDGHRGAVILRPDAITQHRYRERLRAQAAEEAALIRCGQDVAVTRDDVTVQVMANIDLPEEIDDACRYGAAGVGLYRSEFLYIEKSPELPGEEDHLALYRTLIEAVAPHPAIIRTYDLGGRKIARELLASDGENPVLGLRGIRLTLARPEIFRVQVRALLRAGIYGELWIMLPLVSTVEEIRAFRRVLDDVATELDADGIPYRRPRKLGIMIEVPAAAVISDLLAREADFFSIGTNDLIQYALAVDRNNEHVASLYRPQHPALIRLLRTVIGNARRAGIEVSLCGEVAADDRLTPLLLGCGLRRFSVSPRRVPAIKQRIRTLATAPLEALVARCADCATSDEVEAELSAFLAAHDDDAATATATSAASSGDGPT